MKIMNEYGRYIDTSLRHVPSKKHPVREKRSRANVYGPYNALKEYSHIHVSKVCRFFIKSFAHYTGISPKRSRKIFKKALANMPNADIASKRRSSLACCMRFMCSLAGFNIDNLQESFKRDHVSGWGNPLLSQVKDMRADRLYYPEQFFGSEEHRIYPILCYKLKHGHLPPKPPHQRHKSNLSPVRSKLANLGNKKRYRFVGTFVRCGFKSTYHGNGLDRGDCYMPTLLLKNVKLAKTKQKVTDHLWFNYTKGFRRLGMLKAGDKVLFNARVSSYLKGYGPVEAKTRDYDLSFPTKVARPKKVKRPKMPVDDKNSLIGYVMKKNKKFYLMNDRPYDSWYVKRYINWRNLK